jgi:hypothetical protein
MSSSPKTATPPRQPLKSADLDELKQQQLDATATEDGKGDIEHLKGNTPDGKDYEFPAVEANRMHVALIRHVRKPGTRDFDKVEKIVKLSPQEFERMEKNDSFAEYQDEDGEVQIKYDCRPKARQVADKTGDVRTGSPAEPPRVLATLNDAQMRYKELTKEDAPTDKTLGWFIDHIAELEEKLKAEKTTPGATDTKKPLRTKADYQARYKELSGGQEAPADKTIDELKEAITHFENEKGAAE